MSTGAPEPTRARLPDKSLTPDDHTLIFQRNMFRSGLTSAVLGTLSASVFVLLLVNKFTARFRFPIVLIALSILGYGVWLFFYTGREFKRAFPQARFSSTTGLMLTFALPIGILMIIALVSKKHSVLLRQPGD